MVQADPPSSKEKKKKKKKKTTIEYLTKKNIFETISKVYRIDVNSGGSLVWP